MVSKKGGLFSFMQRNASLPGERKPGQRELPKENVTRVQAKKTRWESLFFNLSSTPHKTIY